MKPFADVRARLYAVVLLPMLLFFIISYTLFHFYVHKLIAEDFSHHLQHILSLEKKYLETWLDERLQDIVLLSDVVKNIDGDIDETDTYVSRFASEQLHFHTVLISDRTGYTVSSIDGTERRYVGDRLFYERAIRGAPAVSRLEEEGVFDRPSIVFSAPFRNEHGRIIGVICAGVAIERIEKLLQSTRGPRIGEIYMVDEDGTFITRPAVTSVFTDEKGDQVNPVLNRQLNTRIYEWAVREKRSEDSYLDYAGREVFGNYRWIEDQRWILIGETETDQLYERYSGYSTFLVVIIFIGAFFMIPVILQMANTIAAPLRLLDKEAQRLKSEQGNINSNWEPFRKAPIEIRNLAYSFFTMSEQLSEQLEALEKLTLTDNLTGLYNRKHLFDEGLKYIHMSRRTDIPLSCLMFDIDYFKHCNDTYGHNFGDKVLKEMGSTIKNSIRESDLPARYGGEEFVILAYKADERQAEQLAERLRREVAAQSHLYEKSPEGDNDRKVQTEEVKITISVGVALLNEDLSDGLQSKKSVKESLEKLLSQADEALYRAKENGRNRVERWRGKERPDTQE